MCTQYQPVAKWLRVEADRLNRTELSANMAVAAMELRMSHMVSPTALIADEQQKSVADMLFTLLNRPYSEMPDEVRKQEIARDLRDCTVFLVACSTF